METPVDKGYSWVILFVMWITYMMVVGCCKSFGVLYAEILDQYGSRSGDTAWIQSINFFLLFGLGPVANYLGEVFSFRVVMFAGGIFGSLGILLSAFVTRMEYWFITYSFIAGIGYGLLFTPCSTIVNFYFKKRRALANGIVVGGSGFGAFLLPYIYRSLIDEYAMFGALLIISAIFLNICVCAMLVRQPSVLLKNKRLQNSQIKEKNQESEKLPLTDTREDPNKMKENKKHKCFSINLRRPLFDFSLLKNPVYTLYVVGFVLTIIGYGASFVIIPGHIDKLGYSKQQLAIGMSIIGAAEIFARPFFGWFADLKLVRIKSIVVFCLLASVITSFVIPYFPKFYAIAIYCGTQGTFPAAFWSLMSVLILETTTLDRLPPAMGLLSLFLAFAVSLSPPIAGWIADASLSWNNSFRFVAFSHLAASIVFLSEPLIKKMQCCKTGSDVTEMEETVEQNQLLASVAIDGAKDHDVNTAKH